MVAVYREAAARGVAFQFAMPPYAAFAAAVTAGSVLLCVLRSGGLLWHRHATALRAQRRAEARGAAS